MRHQATTTCWGVAIGVGLLLPTVPFGSQSDGQAVPTEAEPALVWQVEIPSEVPLQVVSGDTRLFVVSPDEVSAYAATSGDRLWSIVAATTFVAADDAHLALVMPRTLWFGSAETGEILWSLDLTVDPSFAVPRPEGVLLVSGTALQLRASDDGRVLWQTRLPAAGRLEPVVGEELILVALENHAIVAVDLASGAVRWERAVGAPIVGLHLARKRAYAVVADYDRSLYAYRASDGLEDWHFPLYAGTSFHPVADSERVYLSLFDNTVQAFRLGRSGSREWRTPLDARPADQPRLVGSQLVVPLTSGQIALVPVNGGARIQVVPELAPDAPARRLEGGGALVTTPHVFVLTADVADTTRTLSVWRRP